MRSFHPRARRRRRLFRTWAAGAGIRAAEAAPASSQGAAAPSRGRAPGTGSPAPDRRGWPGSPPSCGRPRTPGLQLAPPGRTRRGSRPGSLPAKGAHAQERLGKAALRWRTHPQPAPQHPHTFNPLKNFFSGPNEATPRMPSVGSHQIGAWQHTEADGGL